MSTGAAEYTPPDSLKYPQQVNAPDPDWEDVRQQYPEHSVVTEIPVSVDKPVKTWNLPAKRGIWRSFHIPAFNDSNHARPIEIIPADPRIKNAWIQADGNNPGEIYLGTQEQVALVAVGDSDAFFYSGSQPLGPLQGFQDAVYAYANNGASVNILSVRLEYWAD